MLLQENLNLKIQLNRKRLRDYKMNNNKEELILKKQKRVNNVWKDKKLNKICLQGLKLKKMGQNSRLIKLKNL